MKNSITFLIFVSSALGCLMAKPLDSVLEPFQEYQQGKVVVEEGQEQRSLAEMIESRSYSNRELLHELQRIEKNNLKEEIPNLKRLYEIHRPQTFEVIYGERAPYIRGVDVHGKICKIVKEVIAALEKQG